MEALSADFGWYTFNTSSVRFELLRASSRLHAKTLSQKPRVGFIHIPIGDPKRPFAAIAVTKSADLALIRQLTAHIAARYEGLKALQKNQFEFLILHELVRDLSHTTSLKFTASLLTSKIKILLGCKHAYFFYSQEGKHFTCYGHWKYGENISFSLPHDKSIHDTQKFSKIVRDWIDRQHLPIESLSYWQPFVFNDPDSNRSRLIAMLGISEKWQGEWTDDDRQILQMIAYQTVPIIRNAERFENLVELNHVLQEELNVDASFGDIIGRNPKMTAIYKTLERFAKSEKNSTVLIRGETGTGKELIARVIHQQSRRSHGPMIAVNCGAIPRELIESELFGHEKGAFTGAQSMKKGKFELANGGTIFLDEIGDLPQDAQVKLLRVLQERVVERVGGSVPIPLDIQVVAATHVPLETLIKQKKFREDLYYRLNIFPIELPPLRERKDDLPLLIKYLADKHSRRTVSENINDYVTRDCLESMQSYAWPGNVRELENVIERVLILGRLPITHEHLPPEIRTQFSEGISSPQKENLADEILRIKASLSEIEKKYYGSEKNIPVDTGDFTTIELSFLTTLRDHHFKTDETAKSLNLSVFRVRDIFKGLCFKAYVDNGYDSDRAALAIAQHPFLKEKVKGKLSGYIENIAEQFASHPKKYSETVAFRNYSNKIPLEYRSYLPSIIEHLSKSKKKNPL
ncbi:sigma-54 dependent transcriptional regulator [bacterium]|nr:sigma-54 dependent transcriptional regulator [bacterium]